MPRTMTTDMNAAFSANVVRPVGFISIAFASETIYMHTGLGSISWNSQAWIGLGSLLGIGRIEDGCTVDARGITLMLSGLDPTLLSECRSDFKLGMPVNCYLGAYASDGTLTADPVLVWSGRTDVPKISIAANMATITLQCESRLITMNVPASRFYTLEDSQQDYPGDTAFSFVNSLTSRNVSWGNPNGLSYL